jgi:hypothetical protein
MKNSNIFITFLTALIVTMPNAMGQTTGGLPPIQGNTNTHKSNQPQSNQNSHPKGTLNQLLLETKDLEYSKRVSKIRSEIGISLPQIESTISESYSYHTPIHKGEADLSEGSQTWWISGEHGYIVFQNFAKKSINGIVVAVYEGGCENKSNPKFRNIIFPRAIKPYETIASKFIFPSDLEKKFRCIDIYDLNYIN